MNPAQMYSQKKINMIAIFLVLVGGLNWLSVLFLVKKDFIQHLFGFGIFTKIIYLLVGVSSLYLFFKRDTYLPFLGETVLPSGAFSPRTPDNANLQVNVQVTPNAKVVYWASEPESEGGLKNWDVAYNDYSNAGVAIADKDGKATLSVRGKPQEYKVPYKGLVASHVHFRVCHGKGILGPVKTYFIDTGKIENFKNYV